VFVHLGEKKKRKKDKKKAKSMLSFDADEWNKIGYLLTAVTTLVLKK